jgi:hypothetical protein
MTQAHKEAMRAEIYERHDNLQKVFLQSFMSPDVGTKAVQTIINTDMKSTVRKAEALIKHLREHTKNPEEGYMVLGAAIAACTDNLMRSTPDSADMDHFKKVYSMEQMVEMRAMIDTARIVHTVMTFINLVHSQEDSK